jgi:polyhydroxyalkanoate synthase
MLAEQVLAMADAAEPGDPAKREQLKFAARTLVEALSPAHFPMLNPLVMDKAIATSGESLVKGFEHLLADLKRGQLTHVDPQAFKVGENIATTPGKVVHQTALYQLVQYSPTTESVLEVPLVIFPPWINRFYILDLSPEKSFVRWAVEQGLTVFMVSWKSADASMAELTWDDYIRAQIDAIDAVRERLGVKAVHAIGYCVAGTTLAATLAVLARRGEADKVKSATFFTAQVDFEAAGELKVFIDDQQLEALEKLSAQTGYLDGRYMAFTFNLLRSNDLIWNYVIKNYLLGEDYPAFDLLHWNGDVTNLPARWHGQYLRELYRDNKLVVPDALSADGTPINLSLIETPCYIQAGREDHIAPAASVWRLTRHLSGPWTFLLAGSGHIAGVVNPPSSGKYQYWTNPDERDSLEGFVAGASETRGSWWPHWIEWIRHQDAAEVPAKGKRSPGGKGDIALEDAPGSYVKAR